MNLIVSDLCPRGRVLIVDTEALGLDGDRLYAFHPDQRDVAVAVEEILADEERARRFKGLAAAIVNATESAMSPLGEEP